MKRGGSRSKIDRRIRYAKGEMDELKFICHTRKTKQYWKRFVHRARRDLGKLLCRNWKQF